jgi:hypothetical protein
MQYSNGKCFSSILIAMIAQKIIYNYTGFDYNPFDDPFNLWHLIIDFGGFMALCYAALYLINAFLPAKPGSVDDSP